MTVQLPIVQLCNSCGACCMSQGAPPMYTCPDYLLCDDDKERRESAPPEAKELIAAYLKVLNTNPFASDYPCCWLDLDTRQCRYYEHRPQICRDFEVGGQACHGWRSKFEWMIEEVEDA